MIVIKGNEHVFNADILQSTLKSEKEEVPELRDETCRGITQKNKKCLVRHLYQNGFCVKHQNQAMKGIQSNLVMLTNVIQQLRKLMDALNTVKGEEFKEIQIRHFQQITKYINANTGTLSAKLQVTSSVCSDGTINDCIHLVQTLVSEVRSLASISLVKSEFPSFSAELLRICSVLLNDSKKTHQKESEAIDLLVDKRTYLIQRDLNMSAFQYMKKKLDEEIEKEKGNPVKAMMGYNNINYTIHDEEYMRRQREEADQVLAEARQRSDMMRRERAINEQYEQRLKNELMELDAAQNEITKNATAHIDNINSVYTHKKDNMLSEHESVSILQKQIEEMNRRARIDQAAIDNLKKDYEQRVEQLTRELNENATVRVGYETELQEQIVLLQNKLEKAADELVLAKKTLQEENKRKINEGLPSGHLAQQIVAMTKDIDNSNKEVMRLQTELSKVRSEYGNATINWASQIEEGTVKRRAEINALNQRIKLLTDELRHAQDHSSELRTESEDIKIEAQNRVSAIEQQMMDMQNKVSQLNIDHQREKETIQLEMNRIREEALNKEREVRINFDIERKELDSLYKSQIYELERKAADQKRATDDATNTLLTMKTEIAKREKDLIRERQRLKDNQEEVQNSLIRLQNERNELRSRLTEVEAKSKNISQIEQQHNARLAQYEAQMENLNELSKNKQKSMQDTIATLKKRDADLLVAIQNCDTKRDSLLSNVNSLTVENGELKRSITMLKAQLNASNTNYDIQTTKMGVAMSKMSEQMELMKSKLKDASLVHARVKAIKDELMDARKVLAAQKRDAIDNEKSVTRLSKDLQLSNEQKKLLENAIEQCNLQKRSFESQNQELTLTLSDAQTLYETVAKDHKQLTKEYADLNKEFTGAGTTGKGLLGEERRKGRERENILREELDKVRKQNLDLYDELESQKRHNESIMKQRLNEKVHEAIELKKDMKRNGHVQYFNQFVG